MCLVDGHQEVALVNLRVDMDSNEFDHLETDARFPDHGMRNIIWYALLKFQFSDGTFGYKETLRSTGCMVDLLLPLQKETFGMKQSMLAMAHNRTSLLRAYLEKLMTKRLICEAKIVTTLRIFFGNCIIPCQERIE